MPSQHLAKDRANHYIQDIIRRRKSALGEERKRAKLYGIGSDGNQPRPTILRRLQGFEKVLPHSKDPAEIIHRSRHPLRGFCPRGRVLLVYAVGYYVVCGSKLRFHSSSLLL